MSAVSSIEVDLRRRTAESVSERRRIRSVRQTNMEGLISSSRRAQLEHLATMEGFVIPRGPGSLRRLIGLLIDAGIISEEDFIIGEEEECMDKLMKCEIANDKKAEKIEDFEEKISKLKKDAKRKSKSNKRKIVDCFPNECDFIKSCNRRRKTREITQKDLTDDDIKNISDQIPPSAVVIDVVEGWVGQIDEVILCLDENLRSWKIQFENTWFGNSGDTENVVDNVGNGVDADNNSTKDGGVFSLSGQRTNNLLRCFGGNNLPEVGNLPTEPICTPSGGWRVVYNNSKLKCNSSNFKDDDDDSCISLPPKQIINKGKCRKEWICPPNEKVINKFKMHDCFDDDGCYKLPEINICNASNDFKFICPKPNISIESLCKGINWGDLVSKQRAECIKKTPCFIYSEELMYEATNWLINTGVVVDGGKDITSDIVIELQITQFEQATKEVKAKTRYQGLCCNKICYNPDLYIDCDEIIINQKQFKSLSKKFECLICLVRDFTKYSNGKVISGSIPGGQGWIRDQLAFRDSCNLPDEETLWKAVGSVLPEETEKSLLDTKAIKLSMNARSKCELINSDFGKAKYWSDYLDYIEKAQSCAKTICDIKYLICLVNEKKMVINDIVKCLRELISELFSGLKDNLDSKNNVELWFEIQTNINRVFCIVKDLYESVNNKQSEFEYNSIFCQVDDVYYIWGGIQATQTEAITQIGNIEADGIAASSSEAELSANINLNCCVKQYEFFDTTQSTNSSRTEQGQQITKQYLDNLQEINKVNIYKSLYLPHEVQKNGSWGTKRIYNNELYQVVPIVTPCPNYDCFIDIAENGILVFPQTMDLRKPSAFQVYQQFLNEGNVVSDPTNIIKTPADIKSSQEGDELKGGVINGDTYAKLSDYRWTRILYSDALLFNPLQSTGDAFQDNEFPSISPISLIIGGVLGGNNIDNILYSDPGILANLPNQIAKASDYIGKLQPGIPCITWNANTLNQFNMGDTGAPGANPDSKIICVPVAIASSGISSDNSDIDALGANSAAQVSTVTFGKPASGVNTRQFVYRSQNNTNPNPLNKGTISPATPEGVGYYIFPGYDAPDKSDIAFENFPGYQYPGIRSREELLCVGTFQEKIMETYQSLGKNRGSQVSHAFDKYGLGSTQDTELAREEKFAVMYGPSAEQFKKHYPELFLCDNDNEEVLGWSETFKSLGFATTTFNICKNTKKPKFDDHEWVDSESTDKYPIIKSYPPLGYDQSGNVVQAYSRPGHVVDSEEATTVNQTYTAWPPKKLDRIPASLVKYLLNPIPKNPQCGVVTNMSEHDPFINIANTLIGRGNYLMTNNKSSNRFERNIIRTPGKDKGLTGTGVNDVKKLGLPATNGAASIDSQTYAPLLIAGGPAQGENEMPLSSYITTETGANKQLQIIRGALAKLQIIIDRGGSGNPSIPGFPDPSVPGFPDPVNPSLVCDELVDDVSETTESALQAFDGIFSQLFKGFPIGRTILCRKARKQYLCKPMICDKEYGCRQIGESCSCKSKKHRPKKSRRSRNYYDSDNSEYSDDSSNSSSSDSE